VRYRFKPSGAASYALIALASAAGLILAFISLRNESDSGRPVAGLIPLLLIVAGFSGVVSLSVIYIQQLAAVAHAERTALVSNRGSEANRSSRIREE
jgi:hypothetical protein